MSWAESWRARIEALVVQRAFSPLTFAGHWTGAQPRMHPDPEPPIPEGEQDPSPHRQDAFADAGERLMRLMG